MIMGEEIKKSDAELLEDLLVLVYLWYDEDMREWEHSALMEELKNEGSNLNWTFKRMQILKN